jgi:hypothetical protein
LFEHLYRSREDSVSRRGGGGGGVGQGQTDRVIQILAQ